MVERPWIFHPLLYGFKSTQSKKKCLWGKKRVYSVFVLQCDAGAECVGTATDYMLHLQELLGNGAATWRCLCPEARLMARIQNMNYVSFDVAQSLK